MAPEPAEEETGRPAALIRRCTRCPGWPGAPRPPVWLLCLVACWILGAVADADFSILDEAQVLASQMRRLAAEELGVVTMQVSNLLHASCLAALSHSAEPQDPAPRALASRGTLPLLQTPPPGPARPVLLSSSAEPLPRTHFPQQSPHPLWPRPFLLAGVSPPNPLLFPQFALSSFTDVFLSSLLKTPWNPLCPHPKAGGFSKAPPHTAPP